MTDNSFSYALPSSLPATWSIEELNDACFVVKDSKEQNDS
jgi:hypothetical protein